MNKKEIIISWQNQILKTNGIKRKKYFNEIYESIGSKPIKVVSGFRRVGKSFLIKQIAKKLLENKKFLLENILYLNFEDYELLWFRNGDWVLELLQTFETSIASAWSKLILLDEIQLVENWNTVIRTIYEKWNYEIIITGSNSELLSSEIGSNLAWRFIEFQILPFEFSEFLTYNNIITTNPNDIIRHKIEIYKLFERYLSWWGLPEVFDITNIETKAAYIKWIIEKVILDDIIQRFGVRQIDSFQKTLYFIFSCIGQDVSIVNIYNKFLAITQKSITQNQIIKYLSYIVKSFCLYSIPRFDWKLNKIFETAKKYYAVDAWLISVLQQNNTEKTERNLENIIFLHLKKYFNKVEYIGWNHLAEIDFLVKDWNWNHIKIQVCYEINDTNSKREIGNLIKTQIEWRNILIYKENKTTSTIQSIEMINIVDFLIYGI